MAPAPGESPPRAPSSLRGLAVLPARLGSVRLERKVLLDETGSPLFVHAARSVERCAAIERVVVATDSEEVRAAGEAACVETRMTSAAHPSGTDRVREAVEVLAAEGAGGWDVVVNVQADEPEVDPDDLGRLVAAFADAAVEAATLAAPIEDPAELADPSVVKVARDHAGDALLFTRAPVPHRGHARPGAPASPLALRHVGVYAFRPAALAAFCALAVSPLEAIESLEQLRWLEAGRRMRVLDAARAPRGIDTRADYDEFVRRFRRRAPTPLAPPPR